MLSKVILTDVGKSKFFTCSKMLGNDTFLSLCGQGFKKMLAGSKFLLKSLKWCCDVLINAEKPFKKM
jgi:hypothetical protein